VANRAVIFELFGTLLPAFDDRDLVAEMAHALSASPYEFAEAWRTIVTTRETSGGGTLEDDLDDALRSLHAFTHLDQRQAAIDLLFAATRRALEPRTDVLEMLSGLRQGGLLSAAVANATPLVARLWAESTLAAFVDRAAFSFEAGARLPDVPLFRLAADKLGVRPEQCVCVVAHQSLRSHLGTGGWRLLAEDGATGMLDAVLKLKEAD
jgi:putative hydrolase of the HAD superfamily